MISRERLKHHKRKIKRRFEILSRIPIYHRLDPETPWKYYCELRADFSGDHWCNICAYRSGWTMKYTKNYIKYGFLNKRTLMKYLLEEDLDE